MIRNRLASSPAAELHPSIIARIPPLVDRYWHAVGSAPPIDECLRAGGRAAPSPGGLRRRAPARARRLPNDAENIYVQSSDRASDNLPGCPATARRPTTTTTVVVAICSTSCRRVAITKRPRLASFYGYSC